MSIHLNTTSVLRNVAHPDGVICLTMATSWCVVAWVFAPDVLVLTLVVLTLVGGLVLATDRKGVTGSKRAVPLQRNRVASILLINSLALILLISCADHPWLYGLALPISFFLSLRISRELLRANEPAGGPIGLVRAAVAQMVRSLSIYIAERLRRTGLVRSLIGRRRPRPRPRYTDIDRVLVMSHSYIGDAIMQTPAIALIAQALPSARIVVLTNSTTSAVFRDNPFVAESVRCLPPHGEYPTFEDLRRLLRLRRWGRTLCVLDFNGSQTMGKWLAWCAGPSYVIAESEVMPDMNFLIDEGVPTSDLDHHVLRSAAVIRRSSLGSCLSSEHTPWLTAMLGPNAPERRDAERTMSSLGIAGNAVVVGLVVGSAGGFAKNKRWPVERFAELVEELTSRVAGIRFLAFKGPQELEMDYAGLRRHGCLVIEDKSLTEVAGIIARCHLMIGNDSGLAHIAACMGTPVMTIFGPTDWRLVKPYSPVSNVLRQEGCPPCFGGAELANCQGARPCILGVSVQEVANTAADMLRRVPLTTPESASM